METRGRNLLDFFWSFAHGRNGNRFFPRRVPPSHHCERYGRTAMESLANYAEKQTNGVR